LRSTAERIRQLIRLPAHERRVLVRACCEFLLVAAAVRILPVTRLLPRTRRARGTAAPLSPERLAWLLAVAGRVAGVRPTCLEQALVLARTLAVHGVAAVVRIGVTREDGRLRAHAWVEDDEGRVIPATPPVGRYAPLVAAGAPRGRR
jgi:hypothetical protein